MPRSQRILFAVLAALSLGLTTFAAGYLAGGSGDDDRGGGNPLIVDGEIPDGEGAEVIADALESIRESAVDPPSESSLVKGAIRGMVRVLRRSDDPYALFYSPEGYEAFQELTTGQFSGIGVWVKPRNKELEIVSVLPGTPALEAGLRRGDVIQTIDGAPVTEINPDEAVARIKGPEGSTVEVGVARAGDQLSFTITRRSIELPNLRTKLSEGNIGYLQLYGFARGAGDQLRAEVDDLIARGAEAFILDLRDNGGGLFSEAIDVASVFIESGEVVIYREQKADDIVYEAKGDAFEGVPVVVLVNEGTASASEIVAGALQDRDRGIVVGTTTYGKGSVQEIVPLADASALKLTTAAYLTPSGRNINGSGIEPDIKVDAGRAAQKARAVQILQGIVLSTSGSQGG
jgi:carboxyl-terminal processing protease